MAERDPIYIETNMGENMLSVALIIFHYKSLKSSALMLLLGGYN